ncbi:uncharacterized protein MELLADRAFT_89831 [Melampsora larici-populina 98AG31]|uniref:Uncharacterized protein n=1 Tax=Melampsora larici-populina (strain 98AG31 / pathotype 3-4-7) TaxID=747676 RepID=F4RUS7_MELLP|nr:uncharacterized protein MELLADRAFT_89831 [Melampsora larici-populina 98AG31]EGG03747.1 hypothetical protein MELLADRAFT_89831 [Melampsora larici-populina 98AG31]
MHNYHPAPYNQQNHAQPQSQMHGGARGPQDQPGFYPSGFIGHNQQGQVQLDDQAAHVFLLQQHDGQQSRAQQPYSLCDMLPGPNSAQPDHNNNLYHPNDYSNSTYHSSNFNNLTTRGQQSHEYSHQFEQSQARQVSNPNLGDIPSAANNQRVGSIIARVPQLTPPIIGESSDPSAINRIGQPGHTHSSSTGTRPQNHQPQTTQTTAQRRRNGRQPRVEPASVPQLPPPIEANASTSLTTPASTQTQVPVPPTTRATVNLFLPNSLKGKKNTQQPTLNIPTADEMMQKTSVELRMLSEKHATKKETVPPALKNHFMKLHEDLNKVLAINCINHQVSVKAVRKLWGERGARRGANSFQQWYKSEEVSAIFKESSGVANGQGSILASSIWNNKSQEEKDSYKLQNQPIISATTSNSIDSAPDAEGGTARTELVSNARAKNMSLANARTAVNNFMIKWQTEANNMAATYEGNFVMMGVSNFLGKDSYQVVRATPRALKWVDHDRICNPKNHFAAQLHAFVTGTQAGLLNLSQTKLDDRAKCREALTELISTKTQGHVNKWTWKGCKEKLEEYGYYVQLALDSKSCISYIMQDSNQLTQTQARDVLDDILHNKILILETEAGPSTTGPN